MSNRQAPQGTYPQSPKTSGNFSFVIGIAVVALLIVWFLFS